MDLASRPKFRYQVFALTLVAATLRLPEIRQELPPYLFCDEGMFLGQVREMLSTGSWLPSDYRSGGLNIYPVLILARIFHYFSNIFLTETSLLIFGRFIMNVCVGSAGTIAIAYATKKLSRSYRTALLAACLYALSPGLKAFSRYWYPDHYIYALSSLFLLGIALYYDKANWHYLIFLSGSLALVISTKYTGLFLFVPLAFFEFAHLRNQPNGVLNVGNWIRSTIRLGSIFGLTLFFFLILNPGALLRNHEFLRDWRFNLNNYGGTSNGISGVVFYSSHLFFRSLGLSTFILLGLGAWALRKSVFQKLLPYAVFPILIVVTFGRSGLGINRNIAIAIPFVILISAHGLDSIISSSIGYLKSVQKLIKTGTFVLLLTLPIMESSASFAHDLSEDSRVLANTWLDKNIPTGASVGSNEFCSGYAPISRADISLISDPLIQQGLDWYVINSYWNSPFFNSYEVVGEQKYFHFYRFNKPRVLGFRNSIPNIASHIPNGYEIVQHFSSNGPDIIVLRKKG